MRGPLITDKPSSKVARRRTLRQTSTRPEQLMWAVLRDRRLGGLKFRRQHSIGPWIVDFVCLERKLVVEIDGGYHDHTEKTDRLRQRYLEACGFKVVRFTNEDVLEDVEAVAVAIRRMLGLDDGRIDSQ